MRVGLTAVILAVGGVAWLLTRENGELPLGPEGGGVVQPMGEKRAQARETAAPARSGISRPSTSSEVPIASKRAKTAAQNPEPGGVIRIGSWNIEWLGKPEDRSGAARDIAQDPNDLADVIIQSGVDVLGVAEVVARLPGRPIRSREIEAVIDAMARKSGSRWDYVLFPGRQDGDQLTGVLWNTAKVSARTADGAAWSDTEDAPWMLPIPKRRSVKGSYLWNRPPHAMKFSAGDGKTDFVVVMLHMKADYQGDFAAHRGEEAEALVKALPELKRVFKDSDTVLIGDTNCTAKHEAALRSFEAAGFVDLNAAGRATHWRGSATDHALVPSDQPEFAGSGFQVGSDAYLKARGLTPQDFKKRYSDHYPIWTTVKVMPDDD